jgi:autotransporter translocation and assembly factor TamB
MTCRRWLPRVLIGGVTALLLVGAAASWWVIRAYGPTLTRERIEAALATALERPVRVQRVALRPWLGRLELHGVRVATGREDPAPLATVGRAWIRLGIASVWRRELVVSRIAFEDVEVRHAAAPDGAPFAWPATIPDRIDLGPVTAVIATVEIRRARVAFLDPARGRRIVVEGGEARASPRDGGLAFEAQAATVRVEAGTVAEAVERLHLTGRLHGNRLTLAGLDLRWRGERLGATGEIGGLPEAPVLALAVSGALPLRPIGEWTHLGWPLDGSARVDGSVRGAMPDLAVSAKVRVPRLVAGPLGASRVSAGIAWADGVLRFTDVAAEVLGGRVAGWLTLAPARPTATRLGVHLAGASIAELEPWLGTSLGARGRLQLDGQLEGDLRRILQARGRGSLAASGLTLAGEWARAGPATVTADLRFGGGEVEVVSGGARWPALAAEARQLRGRLDRDGPRGLGGVVLLDLGGVARAWTWRDVKGRATVRADASGRWAAPTITGQAEVRDLAVPPLALDHLSVPFRLAGRSLDVRAASLRLGRSEGRVSGTIALPEAGRIDAAGLRARLDMHLDVRTPALHLDDLRRWLPAAPPITGAVALSARIDGTPELWRARGHAASAAVDVAGERLEGLQGDFAADTAGLAVPRLTLRVRGIGLAVEGQSTWDQTGRARVDADPIELQHVTGIPEWLPIRGLVRGRGEVSGRHGILSGSVEAVLERASVADIPLGRGAVRARLDGVGLDAELAFPEVRVTGAARGRVDGSPVEVRLAAPDLTLDRALARAGVQAAGTVALHAELQVPPRDPLATRGVLRLDPLQLVAGGETWRSREAIVLRREPGVTRVERARLAAGLGELSLTGTVADTGALDLALHGRAPLAVLASFRPEIRQAEGGLDLAITASGTLAAPSVAGQGTLTATVLSLRDVPETFRDVRARVAVTPRSFRLVEATASVGGGTLRGQGEAALRGRAPGGYRFLVEGRNVPLALAEGLQTAWDADLELVGFQRRAQLRGEARLVRGSYTRDLSLLRLLLARDRPAPTPDAPGLHLDLEVTIDDRLIVRTPVARFRAGGRLTVQGTSSVPAVFGTMHGRDGQLVFRKQVFTLTSASAHFADPRRLDPILDVRGEARIRGYDVTLHLSGRSDDLQIRLASRPSLPEEDVLALVAFGATREQLGRGGGTALAGEAAGFLIQELFGVSADRAGLDVLEVQSDDAGSRTLRVGKQITPRTLVVFSQGLEDPQERRLRIEYRVFGPVLIAGEQDIRGGTGGDVLVRLRFR